MTDTTTDSAAGAVDASTAEAHDLNRRNLAARTGTASEPAPVRIVHLGLGAFHRAHQAWYTDVADDADEWGIAAFTGRRPQAAEEIAAQDGLYSLIERSADGDAVTVIDSISEAVDGARVDRLVAHVAAPATAIVSLTVTEAGYGLDADGRPDLANPAVAADVEWLRRNLDAAQFDLSDAPRTALARLLAGVEARRRAGAGPLAIVSCDNLPENGALTRSGNARARRARLGGDDARAPRRARDVRVDLDRPHHPEDDGGGCRCGGRGHRMARSLAGRHRALPRLGAERRVPRRASRLGDVPERRFVDDIDPFERRKLWLLNGSHTLLAYAGAARGHRTVAEAIGDPEVRSWVEQFWAEAVRHLPAEGLDLDGYRAALLDRFDNGRIQHLLGQIGAGRLDEAAGSHLTRAARRARGGPRRRSVDSRARRMGRGSARRTAPGRSRRRRTRCGRIRVGGARGHRTAAPRRPRTARGRLGRSSSRLAGAKCPRHGRVAAGAELSIVSSASSSLAIGCQNRRNMVHWMSHPIPVHPSIEVQAQ